MDTVHFSPTNHTAQAVPFPSGTQEGSHRTAVHNSVQSPPLHSTFLTITYIVQKRLPSFKDCVYFTAKSPDSLAT